MFVQLLALLACLSAASEITAASYEVIYPSDINMVHSRNKVSKRDTSIDVNFSALGQ
jgi:hypothetical protein